MESHTCGWREFCLYLLFMLELDLLHSTTLVSPCGSLGIYVHVVVEVLLILEVCLCHGGSSLPYLVEHPLVVGHLHMHSGVSSLLRGLWRFALWSSSLFHVFWMERPF